MDTKNTQKSEEKNQNKVNYSDKNMNKERIENTHFDIIGNEEEGYFIAMGKYRISSLYSRNENETLQELGQAILLQEMWTIITNCIVILTDTEIITRLRNEEEGSVKVELINKEKNETYKK